MSITISVPEKPILKPKIVVFGVGGGGCNAVNNMVRLGLEGVDFVVANTDAQSLSENHAERCIQMGAKRTQGLGAGSHPEIGFEAAEEVIGDISDAIHGAHMVFITAGMGGGTGTGAAPVVARLAKEMGALTVGVVTKPFMFEGNRRMTIACAGIEDMQQYVDTLLIIPNQNLFRIASEQTSLTEAFAMADRVLYGAVAGITNLMVRPGMINLDFADVRTVMAEMGKAMIGTGEASGEKRGIEAAEQALNNPLLDDVSMKGARGVLISISGNTDMKLYEVEEAANRIRSEVDADAQIIFGATTDTLIGDALRVSVVATGIGPHRTLELPADAPESAGQEQDLKVIQLNDQEPVHGMAKVAALASEPNLEDRKAMFQIVPPDEESPQRERKIGATPAAPATPITSAIPAAPAAPAVPAVPAVPAASAVSGEFQATPSSAASAASAPSMSATPSAFASLGEQYPPKPALNPQSQSEKPQGFFGRLKARLMRSTNETTPIAARQDRSSPPSAPMARFPASPPMTNLNQGGAQADYASEPDDQLEIPPFLKSQSH